MKQLTKEQAIAFAESGIWKDWTDDQIVRFQLYQQRLCLPFDRFHKAMEAVLRRPVWTYEFANWKHLQEEYEGKRKAPTFEEIMNMIPEDKRIILEVPKEKS